MMSDGQQTSFVESFLREKLVGMPEEKLESTLKKMYVKPVMLKNESSIRSKQHKCKKRPKTLRKFKQGLPDAVKQCKYKDFEQLRQLWREYIHELLLSGKDDIDPKTAQEVLLKADFHGADLLVSKSKCKKHEGIEGTVVTESKNMFQLVTMKNKVLHIPKKNNIFLVKYPGLKIYIFGDQFCLKPAHRLAKKFKNYIPVMNVI